MTTKSHFTSIIVVDSIIDPHSDKLLACEPVGRMLMHTDPVQWLRIRRSVLTEGGSIRGAARKEGLSRNSVRKMLRLEEPPQYKCPARARAISRYEAIVDAMLAEDENLPQRSRRSLTAIFRVLRDKHGFAGSYDMVRRYCRDVRIPQITIMVKPAGGDNSIESLSIERGPKAYQLRFSGAGGSTSISLHLHRDRRSERAAETKNWIDRLRGDRVRPPLQGPPDAVARLWAAVHAQQYRQRNRATVALAFEQGFPIRRISTCLGISRKTCRQYIRSYQEGGVEQLMAPMTRGKCKADDDALKAAVFRILHQPPGDYGVNRTAWVMGELRKTLEQQGFPVGFKVLRQIIKDAGWKWRKAKIVLTSQDPAYREKLAVVQAILSNLGPTEAFFSIDEFGPFAVKMKAGRSLEPPGPHKVVPQWQKSKGCMIMTAALELSGNQVTHFYSDRKNTAEMIRMMETLLASYSTYQTLYLSWDAASWHISKKLKQRIEEHNAGAVAAGLPRVETAPLPAGAQFLNVIESVFSGMARAIIHNSDYQSVDAARIAIDRYFADRNQHFREHPKRAGKHIWGKELVTSEFSESNNCKDPRWR